MATKVSWTLELERETPGTRLYRDPDNRKHTLYLPKDEAAKLGNPDQITVNISAKE